MNRVEFMTELAALLQDVPAIERQDAMKYYNDYFDDAGEENEQEVIADLESPAKLAEVIKANLGITGENIEKQATGEYEEYRETGYTDARFERKEVPAGRGTTEGANANRQSENGQYRSTETQESRPRTSPLLKAVLIVAIILVASPVIIPCAAAIAAVVFGGIAAIVAILAAIVIVFVALVVVGIILFGAGLASMIPELAVGLALIGTGLVLGVVGVIGTVGSVKLCIVAVPGIIRGIVYVFNRIFRRRKAVA